MADVTTVFAAKDESFAKTVANLQQRLSGFAGSVDGFNSRVASMATGFKGLIGPLVGIGAAVLGAKGAMDSFRNALNMGGRLDDLTKTTGATAGELAILQRAFQLAGSSAEAVGPAMNRLNRFMFEASSGSAAQQAALTSLGFTYQDLANKTPLEQMRMLAERIGAIGSPAQRTAAAMEIFGKSGGELVPLFREFNSEISKAEGQLGGLPAILDSNAQSLADMGDVMDALSSKFDEFTIGLIAGVRGAEDFSTALANIDAAGFGQGIGQSLRVAFEQPLLTSKIIGETLLTGAKVAGNVLINASMFAAESFVKTISAEDYAVGIGERIRAGLMEAVNAFNKLLAFGVEKIFLQPLSNIPGIVGDPFRAALASVKEIQVTLDKTSQANWKLWTEGGNKIAGSLQSAVNSTAILEKDWLDVSSSANNVAANIDAASQSVATVMAPAAERFVTAAQEATLQLQQSAVLSQQIALDFNNASFLSQGIPTAFQLAKDHSTGISMDLNSAATRIEESTGWLEQGANASQTIGLNGSNFAASAALAAANISAAKVDAQIAADSFSGMSERMQQGAGAVNESLDKMREAHHFGQQTSEEVYKKLTDGGMGIVEAQKAASDYMKEQSNMSADMQKAELQKRLAEDKLDRAEKRAQEREAAGQQKSADDIRRRAEEAFTKKMEEIAPGLEKGVETAKKMLEESGKTSGEELKKGADEGGKAMKKAGEDVAKALKDIISPEDKDKGQNFAEEIYKFFKETFFNDFKKRLPQNALS
jgi:hypothetical protein